MKNEELSKCCQKMKFKGYIYPFIFSLMLLPALFSCSGRKSKAEHRDIIPAKDLVSILSEVHITDGLLTLPKSNNLYSDLDSLSVYVNIIEKHGYTKELMDRTMRFYFIKRPKELVKIYDKVLGKLSAMESRLLQFNPTLGDAGGNLWQGKPFYLFPDPSGKDSAWIELPVSYSRFYTLKFSITIFPDDQTIDPHLNLYFETTDTSKRKTRTYFPKITYIKDGQPHTYTTTLFMKELPPVKIKGWFVDLENQSPYLEKHFIVENIVLNTRTSSP